MAIRLYMDEQVSSAISLGLVKRGVDVRRLQHDNGMGRPDTWILDRRTELGRVVFTMDGDLVKEARRREEAGQSFAGVIYVPQNRFSTGIIIKELELVCFITDPEDLSNSAHFLSKT